MQEPKRGPFRCTAAETFQSIRSLGMLATGAIDHHGAIRRLPEIGYSGYLDVELSPTSEGLTDGVPDVENLVLARKMFEIYAAD